VTSIKIVDGTIEGADIAANLDLSDSQKIRLGAGNDLQIYHDGSNSYVRDSGTGNLNLDGSQINIHNPTATEAMARFIENGAVELYYDNSKKLQTTSSGIDLPDQLQVDGTVFATGGLKINSDSNKLRLGAGDDLDIYHDGTNSFLKNNTNAFTISTETANAILYIKSDAIRLWNSAGNEQYLQGNKNAEVHLYYDNSKKFETASDGILASGAIRTNAATSTAASANQATFDFNGQNARLLSYHGSGSSLSAFTNPNGGSLAERFRIDANGHVLIPADNAKLQIGASQDLEIYHTGNHSRILDAGTGKLQLGSDTEVEILNGSFNESMAKFQPNGAVELYYDNSKKFETVSGGIAVQGTLIDFVGNGSNTTTLKVRNATHTDGTIYGHSTNSDRGFIQVTQSGADFGIQVGGANTSNMRFEAFGDSSTATRICNGTEEMITAAPNGAVELYHDNARKLSTTAGGLEFFGRSVDCQVNWNNSSNGQRYGGVYGYLESGVPIMSFLKSNGSYSFVVNDNGVVTATHRWANIYTTDLKLSNEGSQNDVDGTWGNYTIQEGHEDLFLINHKTGKKFKFNLTEVA